ncbi:MAG: FHA domain-containing protein [Myxococcota bacterium]
MNLLIVSGPEQGRQFPLIQGRNILGRSEDCTIQLPSNQISRRHACLTLNGGRVLLEDMGSANGTFINGQRLAQGVELTPNMQFQLGDFVLTVVRPAAQAPAPGHAGGGNPYGATQGGLGGASAQGYGGASAQGYGGAPAQGYGGYEGGGYGAGTELYGGGPMAGTELYGAASGVASGSASSPYMSAGMGGLAIQTSATARDQETPFWQVYRRLKFLGWKGQTLTMGLLAFLFLYLLVLSPLMGSLESQLEQSVLVRGQLISEQLGTRNGEYIRTRQDTRLDLKVTLDEPGVKSAYLIDARFMVMSPTEQRGKVKNKEPALMEAHKQRKAVIMSAWEADPQGAIDGVYHIVTPIRVQAPDRDIPELQGYAYIVYDAGRLTAESAQRGLRLGFATAGAGIVLAGLVFGMFLLTNRPIHALHDDAELVLRGDLSSVESRAKWPELEALANSLNRSFERLSQAQASAQSGARSAQAAQELMMSEARLQALLNVVPEGIVLLDESQRVKQLSRVAERLFGVAGGQAQGQPLPALMRSPELLKAAQELLAQAAASPEKMANTTVTLPDASGGRKVGVAVMMVQSAQGQPAQAVLVMR